MCGEAGVAKASVAARGVEERWDCESAHLMACKRRGGRGRWMGAMSADVEAEKASGCVWAPWRLRATRVGPLSASEG